MRTTVTLDPDVEHALRERMDREGISFKRALNEAVREGLRGADVRFETPTYDLGRPRIDLTKANQLAASLEDAAIAHTLTDR